MLTSALNLPRRLLWRARIHRWNIGYPDPELRHLSRLCNASKISVDVGASLGLYTSHLLGHSAEVWAFEPRRSAAAELERHFSGSPVRVHTMALSDADGETTITICGSDLGRSTLEKSNPVPGEEEVVTTRRLDSFDLRDVGFIKIDVEGHEGAVLRGAVETLKRNRPNLLIEIEERHKPGATTEIPRMLGEAGYMGWFLLGDEWRPLSAFDAAKHQRVGEAPYINNFVFLPSERRNPLV
jgi:FkbM family methyltransferase